MGYWINQRDTEFVIISKNFRNCLETIKNLNIKQGSGGTFYKGKHTPHFAWVNNDAITEAKTLEEAFTEWNWDVELDEEGNVSHISFTGEKSGDYDKLFKAIAPYVESGSYIEMGGEDGGVWRWTFNNGKMFEIYSELDWENNREIVDAILKKKKLLPMLLGINPILDEKIAKILK